MTGLNGLRVNASDNGDRRTLSRQYRKQ